MSSKRSNKTIILSGKISTASVMKCAESLFEQFDRFDNGEDEVQPIKLVMNSVGGSVYDGFGLVGIIEKSTYPIHTYAYGQIMSMALPIYVSGHVRYASPYTTFMYHQLSWESEYDNLEWQKQEVYEAERLQEMFNGVIVKRTKIPKSYLEDVMVTKSDWYFSTQDAKKYKVVDKII